MGFERIEPGTPGWDAYYANHASRYNFAIKCLEGRHPARILDAACGVGYGAGELAKRLCCPVVGVDRNEHALGIARRAFVHPQVEFVQDECETLVEARRHGPFDAVVSLETLEHLERPAAFLAAVKALLQPGGLLIVSVPNGEVQTWDWEFHVQNFNADTFEAMLLEAGCQGIELYGQRFTLHGRLRQEMRAEIHRLRFNPVVRLGAWVQTRLRGLPPLPPALPERLEDLEIVRNSAADVRAEGSEGPFVLMAVATLGT